MAIKRKAMLLLIIISIIAAVGIIYSQHGKDKGPTMLEFKAGETYSKDWQQVESFEQKGLPKSALDIVEQIYQKARQSHNYSQVVKALMKKMALQAAVEEDAAVQHISLMEEEIIASRYPLTSVLQSMLAEMYWSYYQQNRYAILERTATAGFEHEDVRTWPAAQFVEKVIELYNASLSNTDSLKRTALNLYDPVLTRKEGSRKFRPTLYDFLAHRAVDFFINDEAYITRPAYQFQMNDPAAFLPAREFVKLKFETRDTLSFKFQALEILQDLIQFHLEDEEPSALVDVDLKRLKFARQHSVYELKDSLYVENLTGMEKRYRDFPISADIAYQLADFYHELGNQYKPRENEQYKWKNKAAYRLCEEAIARFPDSDGARNCQALRSRITRKFLTLSLEEVNLPGRPFRALVKYRNVNKIFLRAVPVTPEESIAAEQAAPSGMTRDDWIQFYLGRPARDTREVSLPDDGDYNEHAVEIKMPALSLGHYVFLAGTGSDFSVEEQGVATAETWISKLGFLQIKLPQHSNRFYIFHQEEGKPLQGVNIQIWRPEYDPSRRQTVDVKGASFTSDRNGYFSVPVSPLKQVVPKRGIYNRFKVDLRYGDDRLFLSEVFGAVGFYPVRESSPAMRTFFFTDRSIYRPGQTLYFKGIVIETINGQPHIRSDQQTTVMLYDANGQKVSELNLVSNDYGTFSGSFTLPSAGLTGRMRLQNETGSSTFSVEEYKRPRFEVTFEPLTGSFRLNDTVKVKGTAKAYAGANIDNALVQYRVVRRTIIPYWGAYWRWPPIPSEEIEIANGLSTTDAAGNFTIRFNALPDLRIAKQQKPVFSYTVYADVTDISGETRSDQVNVQVGYVALSVDMSLGEAINRDIPPDITITTENLNGEFEAASGTIRIFRLISPGRIFRERLWDKPDVFIMNKDEFYEAFPHDVYDEEDNIHTWEKGPIVFEQAFDTETSTTLTLENLSAWPEGKYRVELQTRDKFAENIELVKFFTLYSLEDRRMPVRDLFWHTTVKDKGEPGETAEIYWGSAAKDIHALLEVYHAGEIVESRWIKSGGEKDHLTLPIKEDYRGNIGVVIYYVKYGRVYSFSQTVEVPWSNKELSIAYETFRDKLRPGQQEEWRIKISGPRGDQVAAEMAAAMYDASLDAFLPHHWQFNIYPTYSLPGGPWGVLYGPAFDFETFVAAGKNWNPPVEGLYRRYDRLDWDAGSAVPSGRRGTGVMMMGRSLKEGLAKTPAAIEAFDVTAEEKTVAEDVQLPPAERREEPGRERPLPEQVPPRTNFNETAFFYPALKTNEQGEILLSFTIPEALTRWKLLGFAHTRDLAFALTEKEIVTQKELMAVPNPPRFLREGDRMTFTAKVVNLSGKDLSGTAMLKLYDALTMQPLDTDFNNRVNTLSFTARKGQSAPLAWEITVPEDAPAVTYRIIAQSGSFSDAEEATLPVLKNRMLVTETLPLPIRGRQTKTFRFRKLLNAGNSGTLRNQRLTLEFTSNPAWYAIEALPYLMESPYQCSEHLFSRYYANSIASHIANSNPKIKRVFDSWKNSEALLSNLDKNQELKTLLLEETPWVLDARSEEEQKKRIGLLFDLNKTSYELDNALRSLKEMQLSNGGWPWFPGMPDNRHITQHIVAGFGHLEQLGIGNFRENEPAWQMLTAAVGYLDARMQEDYQELLEQKRNLDDHQIGNLQIQYLYARSYFPDIPVNPQHQAAFDYWKSQAGKYWLKHGQYLQGMIALALHRMNDAATPGDIVNSLREHALHSEELGMYWKIAAGYFWYQAPIETQALMIEVFDEIAKDPQAVDEMRIWLLKQKQTQDWKTTKATTEACYALLRRGSDWLASDELVTVTVGSQSINPRKLDMTPEAGSGYFKVSWNGSEIKPSMGNITVAKKDEGVAWGAIYWQYFEQLDKITTHETPLRLKKQLFLQKRTPSGPVIEPLTEKTVLQPGDLLKVRIELRVDRDMEYVHLKDMRAAAFEPLNVLSQYKYQDGLGYYESTRDASNDFFFAYLWKGTYVFEYPLRITHKGNFSNGITTIQSMYAPEFSAHSAGNRVRIGESDE